VVEIYSIKKRWRDEVAGDLHTIGVRDGWFQLCQDCKQWSELCSSTVDILAQNRETITCAINIFFKSRIVSVCVWSLLSKGRVICQGIGIS